MPTSLRSLLTSGAGITPRAITNISGNSPFLSALGYNRVDNINITTLTTVLDLTGKFALSYLQVSNTTTLGDSQVRCILEIDDLTIFDGLISPSNANVGTILIHGLDASQSNAPAQALAPLVCNSRLRLRLHNASRNNATLVYNAIPIK